jgi:hypothetical protein
MRSLILGLRKVLERNHPVLQVIENTAKISWLGVWDDFGNWFVTAA